MQFPDPVMISRAVAVAGLAAHLNRGLQRVADALHTGVPACAHRMPPDAAALSRLTTRSIPPPAGRLAGEEVGPAAQLKEGPPHAVMPGGAPPANLCFGNGEPGLPRRPAVRRGHPGREPAYTLVSSMITAGRRFIEGALLDECRHAPAAWVAPLICARALP
jgi:hypothetical protein